MRLGGMFAADAILHGALLAKQGCNPLPHTVHHYHDMPGGRAIKFINAENNGFLARGEILDQQKYTKYN